MRSQLMVFPSETREASKRVLCQRYRRTLREKHTRPRPDPIKVGASDWWAKPTLDCGRLPSQSELKPEAEAETKMEAETEIATSNSCG